VDNPSSRPFVMVSEDLFLDFHDQRRAIDRRYPFFVPSFTDEERETMVMLRAAALRELRDTFRENLLGHSGPYLLPL
jgi:hypothetical protein